MIQDKKPEETGFSQFSCPQSSLFIVFFALYLQKACFSLKSSETVSLSLFAFILFTAAGVQYWQAAHWDLSSSSEADRVWGGNWSHLYSRSASSTCVHSEDSRL